MASWRAHRESGVARPLCAVIAEIEAYKRLLALNDSGNGGNAAS